MSWFSKAPFPSLFPSPSRKDLPGTERNFSSSTHLLWETQHSPAPQNELCPLTLFTKDVWGGGLYGRSDQIRILAPPPPNFEASLSQAL